jgi:RNA polymerase sigma-70 factor (ECF subfamily)
MKTNEKDKTVNEREIVIKAKKDIREFDRLYTKYYPRINSFVYHRVPNEAERNDIVSNIFNKAMRKLGTFRFLDSRKSSFSSWLYRIAISEINQYFRNRQRQDRIVGMVRHNETPNTEDFSYEFSYKQVKKAMQNLSENDQNIIALRFFEKLKHQEIAEILNKKEGTVKVRLHRALNRLRQNLEGGNFG